jgi:hypothetical protein
MAWGCVGLYNPGSYGHIQPRGCVGLHSLGNVWLVCGRVWPRHVWLVCGRVWPGDVWPVIWRVWPRDVWPMWACMALVRILFSVRLDWMYLNKSHSPHQLMAFA